MFLISGNPALSLKLRDGTVVTYTSTNIVTLDTWNFVSVRSVVSITPQQTIIFFVGTSMDESSDLADKWFSDKTSGFLITLGAEMSSLSTYSSFFSGFMWSISLYNKEMSISEMILFSTCAGCSLCPFELSNVCIPDCALSHYWDGSACQACQPQCQTSWGCVRSDIHCNLCQDLLCKECDDYTTTCITCKTNAHKDDNDCVCDDKYYWDVTTEVCVSCHISCGKCTAGAATDCEICASSYYFHELLCINPCPAGYVGAGSSCVIGNPFMFELILDSLLGVVYDKQSNIPALTGNSVAFYPNYDNEDPLAAYLRGFYFNGISSIMHLPIYPGYISPILAFASSLTLSIWANPENDGILISKQYLNNSPIFSLQIYSNKAYFTIELKNTGLVTVVSLGLITLNS